MAVRDDSEFTEYELPSYGLPYLDDMLMVEFTVTDDEGDELFWSLQRLPPMFYTVPTSICTYFTNIIYSVVGFFETVRFLDTLCSA